jgi:hypothetical protein
MWAQNTHAELSGISSVFVPEAPEPFVVIGVGVASVVMTRSVCSDVCASPLTVKMPEE